MPVTLRDLVEKYLAAAGGYGKAVPISLLGLAREEAERLFSALDEDYHISRYLHLQNAAGASYTINGFPQTHVSLDPEIQTIL
ncbi:MAG TPA: hypothetical protein VEU52_06980 [Candidatus Limnocylindrales bacterium]|jgi:hypothetical protein|nr:hypothetical protein [Candidatus Limnocylindrales bacterium]